MRSREKSRKNERKGLHLFFLSLVEPRLPDPNMDMNFSASSGREAEFDLNRFIIFSE